jgi:hypothetical protein
MAYDVEIWPMRGVNVIVIVTGLMTWPGNVVNRKPVDTTISQLKGNTSTALIEQTVVHFQTST